MSHADAARHLRLEVIETARRETGRLVDWRDPAFFSAVRGVMCDADYVAALWAGREEENRRQLATPQKTQAFFAELVAEASGNDAYARFARHLYELYRVGTVHLRAPKVVVAAEGHPTSTPALTWALMQAPLDSVRIGENVYPLRHLEPTDVLKTIEGFHTVTMLPVSINQLFSDFLGACELFARKLEDESSRRGDELLSRWRAAANALCVPEQSRLEW